MKNFNKIYNEIINETKFSSKKWIFINIFEDVEIYEYLSHLSDRLCERYKIELSTWKRWSIIKNQIILQLIDVGLWSKCSKKTPYQKGWTCHLTESNMWLSGIIQNDIEDKVQRIYFSTFLPEKPRYNPADYYFELPI